MGCPGRQSAFRSNSLQTWKRAEAIHTAARPRRRKIGWILPAPSFYRKWKVSQNTVKHRLVKKETKRLSWKKPWTPVPSQINIITDQWGLLESMLSKYGEKSNYQFAFFPEKFTKFPNNLRFNGQKATKEWQKKKRWQNQLKKLLKKLHSSKETN